jgi:hypothetical protein
MMKQTNDLIQLHKKFLLLIVKAERTLAKETVREFFVKCENYTLREAEEAIPINYVSLRNEVEEYANELTWYTENNDNKSVYQKQALMGLMFYKNRAITGLSTIKKDINSTIDPERRRLLTEILNDFITIFNTLLEITRKDLENSYIPEQNNWVDLCELNNINVESL